MLALTGCQNDPADIAALMERLDTQIETAREVEIIYSDSAIVRVLIQGPTMLNYLDRVNPRQEFPDGVDVYFFNNYGDTSSQLTARFGLREERKGEVVVRDSVVWQSAEGDKLETEELIWSEQRQEVYTQKFVVITRPDEIIYGHGFVADQDFSNARINSVEGRIAIDEPTDDPAADRPPRPTRPDFPVDSLRVPPPRDNQ